MSADTQILITLREYCKALEQRTAILRKPEYHTLEDYQRDLARLDTLNVELTRRQSVLRAWARGEQPVMAALTNSEELDYKGQRHQWEMRQLKHHMVSAIGLYSNVSASFGARNAPVNQAAPTATWASSQPYTQAQAQPNPFAQQTGKPTP